MPRHQSSSPNIVAMPSTLKLWGVSSDWPMIMQFILSQQLPHGQKCSHSDFRSKSTLPMVLLRLSYRGRPPTSQKADQTIAVLTNKLTREIRVDTGQRSQIGAECYNWPRTDCLRRRWWNDTAKVGHGNSLPTTRTRGSIGVMRRLYLEGKMEVCSHKRGKLRQTVRVANELFGFSPASRVFKYSMTGGITFWEYGMANQIKVFAYFKSAQSIDCDSRAHFKRHHKEILWRGYTRRFVPLL